MKGMRLMAAVAAASIVACACGSAATPAPGSPSASPTAALSGTPTTAPTPSRLETMAAEGFPIVMGKAGVVLPAEDLGATAGAQIDDFGFDLLRQLSPDGNLCVSPASIALALAMVRGGARGQTAAEMDKVLHSFGADGGDAEIAAFLDELAAQTFYEPTDWNESPDAAGTSDRTGTDPVSELDVSNQVFAQKGLTLRPAFLDRLATSFHAGVGLLDFKTDPEAARLVINRWASDRTKGRIPNVLQPGDVDKLTRIALANAIYLKAGWASPFDPEKTHARSFKTASGESVSVPTMAGSLELPYAAGEGYRAVELPYGGTQLEMTVIVPDDMSSFVAGLTSTKLRSIVAAETNYLVDLAFPRFSIETRFNLKATLSSMGMPTAFTDSADFSGITTEEQLLIQKVIHQANIDVVEKGTTASAVTVVLVGTTGGGIPTPPPHVTLRVDRPFLYLIRDTTSGAILFLGRVDDPSAK
jgi:serpin B